MKNASLETLKTDWKKRDLKNPEYIMEKLDCSYSEALEVIKADENDREAEKLELEEKRVAKKKKQDNALPVGVQPDQLEIVKQAIKDNFKQGEWFTSKQVSKLTVVTKCAEGMGKTSGRWTPHRLKKLEENFLTAEAGTPKKYKW